MSPDSENAAVRRTGARESLPRASAAAFQSARDRRPAQKWTAAPAAQPATIQAVRRKSRSQKNRYLRRRRERVQPIAADAVDRAADRDSLRDNEDEIATRVTRTLAYT